MIPGARDRYMSLRGRRFVLLAPGPTLGGQLESAEEQLEVWEGVLATTRAILANGASVVVEGDPYAGLLVGLVAGEFLERDPAEGERSDSTSARSESPHAARVIVRTISHQDELIQDALHGLLESGLVRWEVDREGSRSLDSDLPVDAIVAFGDVAARSSRSRFRRERDSGALSITIPTTTVSRQRHTDSDSLREHTVLEQAEKAVAKAQADWRQRRASERERQHGAEPFSDEYKFAEDRWLERIPHQLYAQLLIEHLELRS